MLCLYVPPYSIHGFCSFYGDVENFYVRVYGYIKVSLHQDNLQVTSCPEQERVRGIEYRELNHLFSHGCLKQCASRPSISNSPPSIPQPTPPSTSTHTYAPMGHTLSHLLCPCTHDVDACSCISSPSIIHHSPVPRSELPPLLQFYDRRDEETMNALRLRAEKAERKRRRREGRKERERRWWRREKRVGCERERGQGELS